MFNRLKAIAGATVAALGAGASIVAILGYMWPSQQQPPQPTILQESERKVERPVENQVSVVQETVIRKPVETQTIQQPIEKVEARPEPSETVAQSAETVAEVELPKKKKPACGGSEWANSSEPIPIKVGMKVCDETGRTIASVRSISTKGYFGGSISFEAPGKSQPLKCYRQKPCEFPWARGTTFVIESFEDDFGETVALLVAQ